MGAPGLQAAFDIGKAFKTLQDGIMGDGAFAMHLVDCHFFTVGIVPANRRIDDALVVGQHAVYNRPVATGDRVVCKLHGKRLMGGVIFTDDNGTGRILIDSVDDSGAQHAVDAGKLSPIPKNECGRFFC